jgi:type 1 glutamine amidotransferase
MTAKQSLVGLAALLMLPAIVLAADPKVIVFAVGPKDHGAPGRHEYAQDAAAMGACLEHSNVPNIATKIVSGRVSDLADLRNAAVLVLESSGDRTPTEHHALFPQDATTDHQGYDAETTERLKQIDALAKKGLGVVVFHYATYVNNATARKYFTDWVGGFYESGYSRTVVAEWKVDPAAVKHPILNGVDAWTYREEFFIKYRLGADARRTDLLTATPTSPTRMPAIPEAMVPLAGPPAAAEENVGPSVVGWAEQREGGGRGFVMTGVDTHKNLEIDSYRRALLNGIVWAANLEVPAGGVQCKLPQ